MRLIDADVLKAELVHDYAYAAASMVDKQPTIDAVPLNTVAMMFYEFTGDKCACNFNGTDEWLPFVCEHVEDETCPYPEGLLDCWKQYIKHYGERKDGDG